MSDEKNKLFSDPIISSGDRFDQGYNIDDNGVDFNPDEESLYPDDYDEYDETPDIEKTKKVSTQDLSEKSLDDTNDIFSSENTTETSKAQNTGDIFQTEPINNFQEAPIKNQTNNYNFNKKPEKNDYEDEPESVHTAWWIIGGIILIILICLGWFIFGRTPEATKPDNNQAQTEQEEKEEETEKPEEESEERTENIYNNYTYEEPSNSTPANNNQGNSGSSSNGSSNYNNNSSIGTDTAPDSAPSDSTNSDDSTNTPSDTNSDSNTDNSTGDSTSGDSNQDNTSDSGSNDGATTESSDYSE